MKISTQNTKSHKDFSSCSFVTFVDKFIFEGGKDETNCCDDRSVGVVVNTACGLCNANTSTTHANITSTVTDFAATLTNGCATDSDTDRYATNAYSGPTHTGAANTDTCSTNTCSTHSHAYSADTDSARFVCDECTAYP